MSTIVELEEKVKKMLDEIETLKREKKNEEFEYSFEIGERCWFISSSGSLFRDTWDTALISSDRYSQGNVFKTKEEAERERDKRALLVRFRQFRDKCNGDWNPNWNTAEEKKYFIELYPMKALCSISEDVFRSSLPLFGHFKTVDDCKRAIELFGQEINQLYGLEW